MKRSLILAIAGILLVCLAWAWYAWQEKVPSPATLTPAWVGTDSSLHASWLAHDTAAWTRTIGKVWELRGTIIDTTEAVWVMAIGPDLQVRCAMSKEGYRPPARLPIQLTLRGYYIGYQSDPLLGTDIQLTRTVSIQP
jgi:hypothetical protein